MKMYYEIQVLIDLLLNHGATAVLFVWLLFTNNKREKEYQATIAENQKIINEVLVNIDFKLDKLKLVFDERNK